jgi:4-hydroxy-tetrahydrodipicolinate reductase
MNLALVGYGKMGRELASAAKQRGHSIVASIDPTAPDATHKKIDAIALKDVDVVIEFTAPTAVVDNIRAISAAGKNVVVGTTGWGAQMDEVKDMVSKSGIGFLHSSNFSIGVNAFFRMVAEAAKIANKIESFDVYGYELHHNQKADSPSGTAKTIAEILLGNISRKTKAVYDKLDRAPAKDELHFASIRGGSIPGTHVIGFDLPSENIELKIDARGRAGYAIGAVMAAEWLAGKKGFFEMKDFVDAFFES